MNSGYWRKIILTSIIALISVIFVTASHAYSTYSGCKGCHGDFKGDDYVSKQDGTAWGQHLMDGHEQFVDECDACHQSNEDDPVFLNSSVGSTLSKSCVGCHGRQEDVNGSCVGSGGVECGSGAGLRRMHDLNVAGSNCGGCHSGDPDVLAGEHVNPFNYGKTGVVMQDACDTDGTESYFSSMGLDNDGDGDRDASDSDCQTNTPPTQPGSLSASVVTTSSATISWGASTDIDDDSITYLVEYRRNGDVSWSNGGSTSNTNQPLSGLDDFQSYDVRITPNDSTEDGANRTTLNLFTTEKINTPPTQPGTLSASAVTTSSATVSWGASTDIDNDSITYLVEYRRNGDSPWTNAGSTTGTSRPLSGLDNNQPYDVRVTPSDNTENGTSRTKPNLFITETINTPPTQPGSLSISALTTSSAIVSWVASTDINDDPITYQVEYRRNGDVSWSSGGITSNTSQPLSGLDDDQSYDVRITPKDNTEDGTSRTTLNLFTTEKINTPPTQPGALSASDVTISSATVRWGASTDDDDDAITYQVEYRRNGDEPWNNGGTTTGLSQPLSGLDSSQSYDVRVTPNDNTEDGVSLTTPNLFTTEVNIGAIFDDGFEGN